ncbi:serine--tRNA ligase [archaeon CG10_big_fil_rev_8_21_14_0_10_43_11]|nr:MAG: serine--tRNA ligase [archaeon CG10_big_fil_rev_8_21_14_0_10_43_11]
MFDIKRIRQEPELIKQNLARRKNPELPKMVDEVLKKDEQWRAGTKKLEELRNVRNTVSRELAASKGKDKEKIAQMKKVNDDITRAQAKVDMLFSQRRLLLMRIPNLIHDSVPYGADENDNIEVRRWGTVPKRDFEAKNHLEVLKELNLIDEERAAKTAGASFVYLKDDLVLLDRALQHFAIDLLRKRGYTLIYPPLMLRRNAYEGVVSLDDFEEVMYKIEGDDTYLIATSEHAIGTMYKDEVVLEKELPLKFVGVSPCFRKEVGSHGKYTKGLFRMHHFNKVEQFIFCLPKDSWKYHEELQKNAEDLYQALGIPYRVVNVCTGDLGPIAAKKYDTEYLGSDNEYRECGSNSNCTDYQARRLNTKYREGVGKPPKEYVHTLNNTAIATSRTMIAVIETYQQKDGSIKIPDVLVTYMNGKKIIKNAT